MDDDVDYSSMSDDQLEEIARGRDVWSIAPALTELHQRAPERATPVAKKLLNGGDEWLRSTALGIIFHEEQPVALEFMRQYVASCSIPVLREIVELLTVDSQKPERNTIEDLLLLVRDRLCSATESAVENSRDLFFAEYPELRLRQYP